MVQEQFFLKLDLVIGSEELTLSLLKEGIEIEIKDPQIFACLNNTPVYKAKLLKKGDMFVAKVLKIFDVREMEKIKEKFCLEV